MAFGLRIGKSPREGPNKLRDVGRTTGLHACNAKEVCHGRFRSPASHLIERGFDAAVCEGARKDTPPDP